MGYTFSVQKSEFLNLAKLLKGAFVWVNGSNFLVATFPENVARLIPLKNSISLGMKLINNPVIKKVTNQKLLPFM